VQRGRNEHRTDAIDISTTTLTTDDNLPTRVSDYSAIGLDNANPGFP
jgi:hypothetical protein